MKLDKQKHDQDILTSWLGTNGSQDYIKGIINEQKPKDKKPKKIDDDPEAKKNEWLRLARSFSGS